MITVAELDERIERCLAILADNPHSQVFAALAEAYRRRGDFGRAFSVCKSGLKHHPDYAPAYIVLAKLYIHQRMLDDAQAAIHRAIELDGQTRSTDMLEAEVHLATGDLDAARPIIDRLHRSEPRNPAVIDLVRTLKSAGERSVDDTDLEADENTPHEAGTLSVSRPAPFGAPRVEPLTWDAWAEAIRSRPGVEAIFAWNRTTRVVQPVSVETTGEAHVTSLIDACLEIDGQMRAAGWGGLDELRIETNDHDIWCVNRDDLMIGLIGNSEIAFGEVRMIAVDALDRVECNTPDDAHGDATADHANGHVEGSQNVD